MMMTGQHGNEERADSCSGGGGGGGGDGGDGAGGADGALNRQAEIQKPEKPNSQPCSQRPETQPDPTTETHGPPLDPQILKPGNPQAQPRNLKLQAPHKRLKKPKIKPG